MDSDRALGLMKGLLWTSTVIAGPVLLAALVVGVVISVLQVATQVQEATLSYVPKLVACALLVAFMGPWLLGRLVGYAVETMRLIPQLG